MKPRPDNHSLGIVLLCAFVTSTASAQKQTAPEVLPKPEKAFSDAKIGRTYKDSKPGTMALSKAPAGAPNVLIILIDDSGFGQWGTFGGQVPTPNLDRLAKMGLTYTRFHTTALCSPTRAALLTGRNHHSAGTGVITEIGDAYPGYSGQIPKSAAMFAEILRQGGYSTAFIGKNHNIADWETSISGPFDRWPSLQGFDYFYGFIGGEMDQWQPVLYRDTMPVAMEIPKGKEGNYTLNDSLADDTISYIHQEKSVTPDRPFLIYYAPGATHAPHHVPKEWIDKFKGQFNQGWDKYREETYQRQLKLGVIPPETKLTPRPKEIPAWDSLSPDAQRVAERLMEVFAAYTAQTDYEVGRVLDALEEIGQLHNTLVFWEIGDNGASMEGTLGGCFNELATLQGIPEDPAFLIQHIDELGSAKASNHIPVGWAWAVNAPFQWGKQVASHLGGTRNPLVIAWPDRIKDAGGIRTQFHHVIDISPTILEAAHLPQPVEVNGVKQKPIEGVSMVYSFDDPKAAGSRHVQYFEMFGNRALYKDGWIATAHHGRLPWQTMGASTGDFDHDTWELYNLADDFSEANDVSGKYPDKLKELQNDFWTEAKKYNVLPLDDRFAERGDPSLRPSLIAGRTDFTYYSATRIPEPSAANTKNTSHTITATIEVPQGGADGVLVAEGGAAGGYTLYIRDGKPVYEYNYMAHERYKVTSAETLSPGPAAVRVDFKQLCLTNRQRVTQPLAAKTNQMKTRITLTLAGLTVLTFSATRAFAVEGGLGRPISGMSIAPFAGLIPPEPGLAVLTGETYYEGSIGGGRTVPIAGLLVANVDMKASFTPITLLYIWNTPTKEWNFASVVSFPLAWLEVKADLSLGLHSVRKTDRTFGLFDLAFTPIVASHHFSQTDHLAFDFTFWAPTGSYQKGKLVNLSQNTWTFIPGVAYTKIIPEANIELTGIWDMEFDTEDHATHYQNGILSDLEVLAIKRFKSGLGIGFVESWIQQVNDDGGAPPALNGFSGRAFGIGPIVTYSTKLGKSHLDFSARWIHDFDVTKRVNGDGFNFTASLKF